MPAARSSCDRLGFPRCAECLECPDSGDEIHRAVAAQRLVLLGVCFCRLCARVFGIRRVVRVAAELQVALAARSWVRDQERWRSPRNVPQDSNIGHGKTKNEFAIWQMILSKKK